MQIECAVAGIGNTDWAGDYRRVRSGEKPEDSYGYGALAFRKALADSGFKKEDIDGLIVGPTIAYERTGETLGINPRWGSQADAAMSVIEACAAINAGLCNVVALVYGNDQRSAKIQYGGPQAMGGDMFLSYVYHTPWGLTSQGALYALMWQRYMELQGAKEEDLGQVGVAQRQAACANPHAIMQKPITIQDYMESKYICEPLHLYDYCLINDGGVALIISRRDVAEKKGLKQPVSIKSFSRYDLNAGATSLSPRLIDFYRPAQNSAAQQLYSRAGFGPEKIDALQVYDSFSCHILFALEGFGFCDIGGAGKFIRKNGITPDGKLPVNTGGGHLSESYMQGWNHQLESIRQLRGEGGGRQVKDCKNVQYISDVAGKVVSIIYGVQ